MIVPPSFEGIFRAAGWFPDRHLDVAHAIPASHPAASILANLSGLSIVGADPDDDAELMFFGPIEQDALATRWAAELQSTLIGVAEIHNRHGELYVDAEGHLFGNSIIHEAFWFVGSNFQEALRHILSQERSRPMLLSNQTTVRFYGRDFTRDDAEVLTAASFNRG